MPEGPTPPGSEPTPHAAAASGPGVAQPGQRRWTLGRRLAAAYGALALLVVAAVAASVWSGSRLLAERSEALAMAEAARLADRIAALLERADETGAVLAASFPPDPDECVAALEAAALARPTPSGRIVLVGPNRRVACTMARERVGTPAEPHAALLTVERIARPPGPTLVTSRSAGAGGGGGGGVVLAHPVRRGTRIIGTLVTEVSFPILRTALEGWSGTAGFRLWLVDSGGGSAALAGGDAPPPALAVDPLFGPEAAGARPLTGRVPGALLVATRLGDDLALLAAMPPALARPAPPLRLLAPPLAFAALLLAGLAVLFWAVGHFVLGPLEAATRRLESPGAVLPDDREARAPAEIADLVARLGAARATREEAVRLRDLLLREANHRIKNHLALVASFLRLQERHLSDHAALQALRAAEGRMRAIALTYELLHERGDDRIPLDRMLDRTARAITARDSGGPVVETELDAVEVPADVAVKVGLLVNELATNSLKHAFVGRPPGTVRISLRRRGAGFVLRVSDDGGGHARGGSPEPRHDGRGEPVARHRGAAATPPRSRHGARDRLGTRRDQARRHQARHLTRRALPFRPARRSRATSPAR